MPKARDRSKRLWTALSWKYDVAPDGRLLINTVLDDSINTPPITLIQNWQPPEATPYMAWTCILTVNGSP